MAPGQEHALPESPQSPTTAPPFGAPATTLPPPPGATLPPPPGAAWPPPAPGAPFPSAGAGAPPKRGWSTTKILVVVGLAVLVPVLGLAGLFLLGTIAEGELGGGELSADELPWAAHEDPEGRYVVDMPGRTEVDIVELPASFGTVASVQTASVIVREFGASVTRTADVVPQGQTFASLPYSPTAVERSLTEAGVFDDAKVVGREVVAGTGDLQMSLEARGVVDGEEGVMWSRLVIVGTDLFELNVVGSIDDSDEIVTILERMVASFEPS